MISYTNLNNMKIVFVSDTFHHHQKGVADALYRLCNRSYCFITTSPLREERKRMGFSNIYPEYVLDISGHQLDVLLKAQQIIDDADVVVLGSASYDLLRNRLEQNKLTFRYSERLWKHYKHFLKTPFYMFDNYKTKGCMLLCSSAFAAHDYNMMGAFKGRCYKWGYFTKVDDSYSLAKRTSTIDIKTVHLMWCSRFLKLKHPELPIALVARLKAKGYSIMLNMYGTGEKLDAAKSYARKLEVDNLIRFHGNVTNCEIINALRCHEIFLFTSDRNEGWGAVANESMSNGCVIVASDEIGSIPYLVSNRENGCIFKSSSRMFGFHRFGVCVDRKSLDSLEMQVEWLLNNPTERYRLSKNALMTMQKVWSPEIAAKNLITLIDDIKQGRDTSIKYGPCSKA